MRGPDNEKDDVLRIPTRQHSTPHGPGEPSAGTTEFKLTDLGERFDLLAELGRGGMGIVYKARDRETGAVIALKILQPEIAARPELIERFKAELLLTRKITHKNVCRTYELHRFGPTAAIAMEYIEGESLRAILQRFGGVPLRRGLEWVGQICSALAEAHAQGVVHRDLKPENILIARDGTVKVMDFGIARSLETEATQTGNVIGTPAYMSPEQVGGKPADARSDIYSLGLIMYEMFTGQPTFHADTPLALALKRIHETPPPPRSVEPDLPERVDCAIQKCLEKDPRERFQSVVELEVVLTRKPKPVPTAILGEEVALPLHIVNPRFSDLVLIALGGLGLAGLLLCGGQVVPETGLRVRLTRQMFLEKAQEELRRRGRQPTANPELQVYAETDAYDFLAERAGPAEARNRLLRDLTPYHYRIRFRPDKPGEWGARVTFEPDGSLYRVNLPVLGGVLPGEGLPHQEAFELAKREIQQGFGVDTNQLILEHEGPLTEVGRHGHSFRWEENTIGVRWRYQVDVFDRPTLLMRWTTLPEGYRPPRTSNHPLIAIILWSALALGFFLARRLFSQLRLRNGVVLGTVGLACGMGFAAARSPMGIIFNLLALAIWGVLFALWLLVLTPTLIFLAQRRWPQLTANYSALIQLRPAKRAAGLAVARGVACGLLLLGLYTVLLWLGTSAGLTWPRLNPLELEMNSFVPPLTTLSLVVLSAMTTAYSMGFFLSLARRWTSSTLLLAALGGALELAFRDFSVPPQWFLLFLLFTLGVAFARILMSFDLLTLLVATFTFHLWQHSYILIKMFAALDNWGFWLPFVLWAALFTWGAFTAFRPVWDRAGRRVAEIFE